MVSVLGSVQSWSRGHASRTCPVPRTLKPAGVWLAPPPVPSCVVYIVQSTDYSDTETERRFFLTARAPAATAHGSVCRRSRAAGNEKIKKPARLSQTSLCACLFSYYGCTPLFSLLALALGAKKHTYYEQRLTTRARAARGISASSTCSQHFAVLPGVVTRC